MTIRYQDQNIPYGYLIAMNAFRKHKEKGTIANSVVINEFRHSCHNCNPGAELGFAMREAFWACADYLNN